jgi:hypothetical protein
LASLLVLALCYDLDLGFSNKVFLEREVVEMLELIVAAILLSQEDALLAVWNRQMEKDAKELTAIDNRLVLEEVGCLAANSRRY